jgi:predicted nucleic acid-binding protein
LELAPAGLALSIITYGELYEGAYYSRNPEPALAGLHFFLEGKKILPLSQAVIEHFAIVRVRYSGRLGSKLAIWTS